MTDTVIHSARLVTDGTVTDDAWAAFTDETVTATGRGDSWREHAERADVIDAAGRWLTPGFIDIHGHGGGGAAFDEGSEAIGRALSTHRAHGTTRSVLSLVTAGLDDLEHQLADVRALADADPLILGAHLEGPFLDPGHKGAHDPSLLRDPAADAVARLLDAGGPILRQVTLAPELPGASEAIRAFTDAGVAVAVGHTDCDAETAQAAFDAGAGILTHTFNAMNGIHHRRPGPIIAAMRTPHVTLELIADGIHVHPDVIRLAFDGAPNRIALITDAMAAAGVGDGSYVLGGLAVEVVDGCARLVEGGAIAGSTLTLDHALRTAVTSAHVSVADAVTALTRTPARAIGRAHDLGSLAPGFAADALLLDDDFAVTAAWGAGRRLV